MKKGTILLVVATLFAFVACQKTEEAAETAAAETKEMADKAADKTKEMAEKAEKKMEEISLDVPEFSSPEIQEFAEGYADYYKEVISAAAGNAAVNAEELQKKGMEWSKKATEKMSEMTPDDVKKWSEWVQKLTKKQQEAAQ